MKETFVAAIRSIDKGFYSQAYRDISSCAGQTQESQEGASGVGRSASGIRKRLNV